MLNHQVVPNALAQATVQSIEREIMVKQLDLREKMRCGAETSEQPEFIQK